MASTLDHCLWECRLFDEDRKHERPSDEMTARLGWSLLMSHSDFKSKTFRSRLAQMAKIREKVWKVGTKLFPRSCIWADTESGASYRESRVAVMAALEEKGD